MQLILMTPIFDPIFVTATLLSPWLRYVLNEAQKKAAKQYILKLMNQDPIMTDDENMTQNESLGDEGSIDEPNEPSLHLLKDSNI